MKRTVPLWLSCLLLALPLSVLAQTPTLIAAPGSPKAPPPPVLVGTPLTLAVPALKITQGGFLPGSGSVTILYPAGLTPTLPLTVGNGTLTGAAVTTAATGQFQVTGTAAFASGHAGYISFTDPVLGVLPTRSYWTYQPDFSYPRGNGYTVNTVCKGNVFVTSPGVPVAPVFTFNNNPATIGGAMVLYQVQNVQTGAVVAAGAVPAPPTGSSYTTLTLPGLSTYGGYAIFLYGLTDKPGYGKVLMSTVFSLAPPVPDGCNLADLPAKGVNQDAPNFFTEDPSVRTIGATGPFRLPFTDATNVAADFPRIDTTIASEQAAYVTGRDGGIADPVRGRDLLVNFPSYVNTPAQNAGVTAAVAHCYAEGVHYFEGANEPNVSAGYVPTAAAFYAAVKAGNPNAQVCGPTGVNPIRGLTGFLQAGGGNTFDVFDCHAYIGAGNYVEAERILTLVDAALAASGQQSKPRWQTEQGDAPSFGRVVDQNAALVSMTSRLLTWERHGFSAEHSPYWFTHSGFNNFPTQLENNNGSWNATALVLWQWAKTLWETPYASAYDFTAPGNAVWYGDRFDGQQARAGQSVSVFAGNGTHGDVLKLTVAGAGFAWNSSVVTYDAFGNKLVVACPGGVLTLPPSDGLIRYVLHPSAWTLTPMGTDYGPDLLLAPAAAATTSVNQALAPRLNDGLYQVPFSVSGAAKPWGTTSNQATSGAGNYDIKNDTTLPATITFTIANPAMLRRIVVSGLPATQTISTPLAFDVYTHAVGAATRTKQISISEPAAGLEQFSDQGTYASHYWQFWAGTHTWNIVLHSPGVIDKIEVDIYKSTYGGTVNDTARQFGGTGSFKNPEIAEIAGYAN